MDTKPYYPLQAYVHADNTEPNNSYYLWPIFLRYSRTVDPKRELAEQFFTGWLPCLLTNQKALTAS